MAIKSDRKKKAGARLPMVVALIVLLFCMGVTGKVVQSRLTPQLHWTAFAGAAVAGSSDPPRVFPDFVTLAKKLEPVVVNISTTQMSKEPRLPPSPFGENDPFNEFWRRFFGGPFPPGLRRQQSLGSGFIVGRDGTILTNHHVVEGADKIVVKLSDSREFQAKVVGKDQKTDIAIVKIEAENLPVAALGDSDQLEVGDWVMAIGNPFGLDHTVTSGIVSAKSRRIGAGPYDDFIQTDASINPGNSGGPLVNLRGEVVGVNTAIVSRSGGNIGIGFAIPINLVKDLLPQLKETGKVVRGYMGVVIQRVTPEIAQTLGLEEPRGALVADVSKGGPADHAGVQVGDVIAVFDGQEVRSAGDLPFLVARTDPGKQVRVTILRNKKELTLSLTVGEMKEDDVAALSEEESGLAVQAVTPQIARSLGLDSAEGVVVTSVKPGSPADDAGLRRGDVILEIDRLPIQNLADYKKAMADTEKDRALLLLVRRGQNNMFLALKP